MNEPTKYIQELLPQMDCPIGAKIIFQQNQLKNHNFKRKTSVQDQRRALQISIRLAPISSKSPISAIPANIKLQLNHNGVLSSISKRNQQLKLINTKITITKFNIIIIHILTKISTLYYLMQAITLIIIIYTSVTIMQKLTKHYATKTTPTHPNNIIISVTAPTYSANINTNASAIKKSMQSL